MKQNKIFLLGLIIGIVFSLAIPLISLAAVSINTSAVTLQAGETYPFTALGGTQPYTWAFSPSTLGSLNQTTGASVIFAASKPTSEITGTITVTDEQKTTNFAVITVQPQGSGGGSGGSSGCPPGQTMSGGKCVLTNPAPNQLVSTNDFRQLLKDIITYFLYFAGAIAVIFLMVGGFQYISSRGNEETMERAKKTITAAVIGIVLIVMSFAIVAIINTLLTQPPPT